MELSWFVVVQHHGHLSISPVWACPCLTHMGLSIGWNTYLWNCSMGFLRSKFYRIVFTCSCATPWAFAHNMAHIWARVHIWNRLMDFLHSKFHGVVSVCSCATCNLTQMVKNLSNPVALLCPDFADPISLKQLDGFTPSHAQWNNLELILKWLPILPTWACPSTRMSISESVGWIFSVRSSLDLDLLLCSFLGICPFAQYSLGHGPYHTCLAMGHSTYLWNHWWWLGGGVFSKVVITFNHVGGSFNLLEYYHRDVWIIPFFF